MSRPRTPSSALSAAVREKCRLSPSDRSPTSLRRFKAYPWLAKQIREIVLMGGSLSGGNMTPAAEFNIYVDPEGASVVFRSGVRVTMVGLDVTRKCILTDNHVREIEAGSDALSHAAARIARNDLERWRQTGQTGSPGRAMHDPLAVATFIDRGVVRLREYFVAVETQGELTAGETVGYMKYLCANQRRSKTCPLFPKPLAQPLCPSRAWRWRWTQHDSSRC